MSADVGRRLVSATALRAAFDRSFAEAPKTDPESFENFLAVRVGGHPYAFRLSEIAGLYRERKIVPLIGQAPHLIGIAGFRGAMAPVYDLSALLGHMGAEASRWLVLARARSPVGLAFELFEAHARVSLDGVNSSPEGDPDHRHVRGAVDAHHEVRPIIHVASVLEAIARQVSPDNQSKER